MALDEQQVRGQDSSWLRDWRNPDSLAARHRAIDDVIARALAAVIAEEDDGAVLYHGDLVELAHGGRHDRPLQLRGPGGAVAATHYTRAARGDRLRRRAERRAALTAQAAGYAAIWHAHLAPNTTPAGGPSTPARRPGGAAACTSRSATGCGRTAAPATRGAVRRSGTPATP